MKTAVELRQELNAIIAKLGTLVGQLEASEEVVYALEDKIKADKDSGLANSSLYKSFIEALINQASIKKLLNVYLDSILNISKQAKERHQYLSNAVPGFFNQTDEKGKLINIAKECEKTNFELAAVHKVDEKCMSLSDSIASFGSEIHEAMYYLMKDYIDNANVADAIDAAIQENEMMVNFCQPWIDHIEKQHTNPWHTALQALPTVNQLELLLINASASNSNSNSNGNGQRSFSLF